METEVRKVIHQLASDVKKTYGPDDFPQRLMSIGKIEDYYYLASYGQRNACLSIINAGELPKAVIAVSYRGKHYEIDNCPSHVQHQIQKQEKMIRFWFFDQFDFYQKVKIKLSVLGVNEFQYLGNPYFYAELDLPKTIQKLTKEKPSDFHILLRDLIVVLDFIQYGITSIADIGEYFEMDTIEQFERIKIVVEMLRILKLIHYKTSPEGEDWGRCHAFANPHAGYKLLAKLNTEDKKLPKILHKQFEKYQKVLKQHYSSSSS